MYNTYLSNEVVGGGTNVNFSGKLSGVENGSHLTAVIFAFGAGPVQAAPAGWTLLNDERNTGTTLLHALIYRKDATVNNDAAFSLDFDSPGALFGWVIETSVRASDTNLVAAFWDERSDLGINPPAMTADSLVSFFVASSNTDVVYGYDQLGIYANTSETAAARAAVPEYYADPNTVGTPNLVSFNISRQFANGEDQASGNIFLRDSEDNQVTADFASVMLIFEGETNQPSYPNLLTVNGVAEASATIVQDAAITVAFDGALPATFDIVNTSFGDVDISYTKPDANSVQFTIGDNARPDQDITLSFEDGFGQFAEITVAYDLASGWDYVVRTAAAPAVDDEIAAGDIVAWNNANFDLLADGDDFVFASGANPNPTEFIQYFTIDVSDNAAYSNTETVTVSNNNNVPVQISPIPNFNLVVGDSVAYDLTQHFNDTDNDTLVITSNSLPQGGGSIVNNVLLFTSAVLFENDITEITVFVDVFDGTDSIPASFQLAIYPNAIPNPVIRARIYESGVLAPGEELTILVRPHGDENSVVVPRATYTADSESMLEIDHDALEVGVGYDIYARQTDVQEYGLIFRNVIAVDANA